MLRTIAPFLAFAIPILALAQPQIPTDSITQVERLARVVPQDEADKASALADRVLAGPHRLALDPTILSVVRARLTSAEVAYWQGTRPGIEEQRIVAFVNLLTERLKLPEHAKTTPGQLRTLRMQLLSGMPSFMGRGMQLSDIHVGQMISSRLSPLQTAQLVLTLVDQKFYNPAYRVTPIEWERNGPQIQTRMGRRPSIHDSGYASTQRKRALEEAISTSISSMSQTDGLRLLSEGMSALGLD